MSPTAEKTKTGTPKQLARYSVEGAERRLVAQRVDGVVQLRDEPVGAEGRRYLVEPELTVFDELGAIVADYVATARRVDRVPMQECWF